MSKRRKISVEQAASLVQLSDEDFEQEMHNMTVVEPAARVHSGSEEIESGDISIFILLELFGHANFKQFSVLL